MGVWGVFRGSVGWGRGTEKGLLLSNQILDNPHPSNQCPRQPLPLIPSPDELSGPGAVSTFVLRRVRGGRCPWMIASIC